MAIKHSPRIVIDGLVAHYDAANTKSYPSSGTAWKDLSGKGNNGTIYHSPSFSNDNAGKFNFNTSDYVDCGNILSQTAYTKSTWFRPESATRNIISGYGGSGTGQHAFWMNNTDKTLQAGHRGAWSTVSHTVPSGDMLNQWWNGAVTYNNLTGWVLYLNGVQVDTDSSTTDPNGSGVYIGRYGSSNWFDGDIAEVLIYDRAITAAEVLQNYQALKERYL